MFKTAIVATLAASACALNIHDRGYYEEKFINWISANKMELPAGGKFVTMLQNFANNDDIIEAHNAKKASYTLGHNQFSHLSFEEFRDYVKLGLDRPAYDSKAAFVHAAPADLSALPASIDWTTKGAVTPVKDQGQCGSCWSFSSTGAMESSYFNKHGSLQSMSEQNFVDCDNLKSGGRDHGCSGGLMDNAFSWANKNGGICSETAYPYKSGTTKTEGTCADTSCKNAAFAPSSYTDVTPNSDSAMMSALAQQTVAIAIDAESSSFQLYKSGVYNTACGTNLDHGVLAVGYGTSTEDYYKVKNSWGTGWGDGGYIYLARGSSYNKGQGQCGMLMEPSYPNY